MFFSKKKRVAQGALEYLLMIGAAILILAVVVLVLTSVVVEGDAKQDAKDFNDHFNALQEWDKGQGKQPIDPDSQAVIYSFEVSGVSGDIVEEQIIVSLSQGASLENLDLGIIGVYGSIDPSVGKYTFSLGEEVEFKVYSKNMDYNKSYFVKVIYKEDDGDPNGEEPSEQIDEYNWIKLSTCSELASISENLDANYVLINNIDCSETKEWDEGKGWKPIGNNSNKFMGIFDGNNFVIKNLYINRGNESHLGLFGYVTGASISNVGLEEGIFIGNQYVGQLIGRAEFTKIFNSYSSGEINGTQQIGGLIGYIKDSIIFDCYSIGSVSGSVSSNYYTGGLIGNAITSDVIKSYFRGSVSGQNMVGGLIGISDSSNVSNCYFGGVVSGYSMVGGLIGNNGGSNKIFNSYSVGSVTGEKNFGGLIGYSSAYASVTSSYWNKTTSGQGNSAGGEGKTNDQMKQESTFVDWDFEGVWRMPNNNYPKLIWKDDGLEAIDEIADCINFNANPIPICTLSDLNRVRENLFASKKYVLMNDIDASATRTWNDGAGWEPIGSRKSIGYDGAFEGTFDGNNYKISNLYINRLNENYVGLFGFSYGATIKNVGVVDSNINGNTYVGGVVGYLYSFTSSCSLNNSYFSGRVNGNNSVGGIVGESYQSYVSGSYFVGGDINGNNNVGGVVGLTRGYDRYSSVNESYFLGEIKGNYYVGGVVGRFVSYSSLNNSYSNGSINGNKYVGGVIGHSESSNFSVDNSYFVGNLSGGEYVGGVVGYMYWHPPNYNYNSYWNKELSNANNGIGKGKTTEEMMQEETFVDWDFDTIWNINEGNDYPRLKWQIN